MPNRVSDDDALVARMEELQRMAREAGRDPIPVTVYGASRDPARIERWAAAGVVRSVFWLPPAGADEIEPKLDEITATIERLRSAAA
jgi:hypothetical protein